MAAQQAGAHLDFQWWLPQERYAPLRNGSAVLLFLTGKCTINVCCNNQHSCLQQRCAHPAFFRASPNRTELAASGWGSSAPHIRFKPVLPNSRFMWLFGHILRHGHINWSCRYRLMHSAVDNRATCRLLWQAKHTPKCVPSRRNRQGGDDMVGWAWWQKGGHTHTWVCAHSACNIPKECGIHCQANASTVSPSSGVTGCLTFAAAVKHHDLVNTHLSPIRSCVRC
jgi:hypothetical protein